MAAPSKTGVKVWIETTAGGGPWFSIASIVVAIAVRYGCQKCSAAMFDLFGANSGVSRDDIAVRKPHDECWIVGAAIRIDEEPRKSRKNGRGAKNLGETAGDPGGANIIGDMTGELLLAQTKRAIGFWQRVRRVVAKEEDARRKISLDSLDGIARGAHGRRNEHCNSPFENERRI